MRRVRLDGLFVARYAAVPHSMRRAISDAADVEQFFVNARAIGVPEERARATLDAIIEFDRQSPWIYEESVARRAWLRLLAEELKPRNPELVFEASTLDVPIGAPVPRPSGTLRSSQSTGESLDRRPRPRSDAYCYGEDDEEFDLTPWDCWRCDATAATSDLGVCDACLADLRG